MGRAFGRSDCMGVHLGTKDNVCICIWYIHPSHHMSIILSTRLMVISAIVQILL